MATTGMMTRAAALALATIVGLAVFAPVLAGRRPLFESGPAAGFEASARLFGETFVADLTRAAPRLDANVRTNFTDLEAELPATRRAGWSRLAARWSAASDDDARRDVLDEASAFLAASRPEAMVRFPVCQSRPPLDGVWIGLFVAWLATAGWRPASRRALARKALVGASAAVFGGVLFWGIGSIGHPRAALIADADAVTVVRPPIPFAPNHVDLGARLVPPGGTCEAGRRHWLGTDSEGHDVATHLVWGARTSLVIGAASVALTLLIGVLIGAICGLSRGADLALSRVIEVFEAFPPLLLILSVVAFVGSDPLVVILVIAGTGWTKPALLTRSEVARLRTAPFVEAVRAMGLPYHRILVGHVLPNAIAPAFVHGVFAVAGAILVEAGLSFLGLGAADAVSWGKVILSGSRTVTAWWLTVFPGAALFVTIVSLHVLGAGLRSAQTARAV